MQISGCTGCYKRWYFTFNGVECKNPLPINGILESIHRHHHIEGYCIKIDKGKVQVGFWVGNCPSLCFSNAHTG